jgi:hypothetical protein
LAFSPNLRRARLTVERCRGFRSSLRKNVRPGAFMRVRSTSQALMAPISSPRRGWVVERPPLRRARAAPGFHRPPAPEPGRRPRRRGAHAETSTGLDSGRGFRSDCP